MQRIQSLGRVLLSVYKDFEYDLHRDVQHLRGDDDDDERRLATEVSHFLSA